MVTIGKVNLRTTNKMLERFAGTTGMKTGFICASGLNLVATVNRGGRQLLAVVLGGSSERERDQMAGQLLLKGFAGDFKDSGKSVCDGSSQAVPDGPERAAQLPCRQGRWRRLRGDRSWSDWRGADGRRVG